MADFANIDDEIVNQLFDELINPDSETIAEPTQEFGNFTVSNRVFRSVDPEAFLQETENKNTKKKTEGDLKLFLTFLITKNEPRFPEFTPPEELNNYLCEFILGVTKKDGSEYEPGTIRGFFSSIDRHLKSKESKVAIFNDIEFAKARAVLKRKQQQLKSCGLGNKPKAAATLTEGHIEKMMSAGTLGNGTPRALTHSMWLICTTYFGMRTGKECHDLCWGDISLELDENSGEEFLLYNKERQTKTRSGSNPRDTRYVFQNGRVSKILI